MTHLDITKLIFTELDSTGLKNPKIRKIALERVWEYTKEADEYVKNGSIMLPKDKKEFKTRLARIKGKDLNRAESSVINRIYFYAGNSSFTIDSQGAPSIATPIKPSAENKPSPVAAALESAEKELIDAKFLGVTELENGLKVPDCPGVYCVKLREGATFPKEFGPLREDRIIYIGQASGSLRKRLWEQELNHKSAATFFRSIGAILGYLPPKGSLVNKENKKNYKFSNEDTQKIIEWMKNSLLVNFIEVKPTELNEIEKALIKKYSPTVNITHNPSPCLALKEARKRCIDRANEKS